MRNLFSDAAASKIIGAETQRDLVRKARFYLFFFSCIPDDSSI